MNELAATRCLTRPLRTVLLALAACSSPGEPSSTTNLTGAWVCEHEVTLAFDGGPGVSQKDQQVVSLSAQPAVGPTSVTLSAPGEGGDAGGGGCQVSFSLDVSQLVRNSGSLQGTPSCVDHGLTLSYQGGTATVSEIDSPDAADNAAALLVQLSFKLAGSWDGAGDAGAPSGDQSGDGSEVYACVPQ